MRLIAAKDLSLGSDGRLVAEHISFEVNPGDYLFIVGENGSGKTTLMQTLLRLIPPAGGGLAFGGDLVPSEIGYLPQQTPVQKDFRASVREVVYSGLLSRCGKRPFYRKEEKRIAEDNMARLGITVIMISHAIASAMRYATHILHLGETIFSGTAEVYLRSPHAERFLRFRKNEPAE